MEESRSGNLRMPGDSKTAKAVGVPALSVGAGDERVVSSPYSTGKVLVRGMEDWLPIRSGSTRKGRFGFRSRGVRGIA